MKRNVLFVLLALGIAALVSAQAGNFWPWGPGFGNRMPNRNTNPRAPQITTEDATVSGVLTLVRGSIAIKNGDITYMVMGLNRYIGFIDTLKEGARVTIEGQAMSNPQDEKTKFLVPSKLTIAEKDYDVGRPRPSVPQQQATPTPPAPARPSTPPKAPLPPPWTLYGRRR